ncbi:MAG: ABC transporter ATP-binding protein [Lachnospirales bacterium]
MIEAKNLMISYDKKKVIHNINFTIDKGENISIIGKNGCGKSTILKALCGILDFEGEILIDGRSVKKYTHKEMGKKISLLSQISTVYFNYSVYDTVMMGRFVHRQSSFFGSSSKEDNVKVLSALNIVGMAPFKDVGIETLSGGQLQRVMLAKVIAQNPEILLLDEPTNHLDFSYQIEFIEFLKKWGKENNKTIIGVLHDINLALEFAPKIMLIDEGNIIKFDEPEKVIQSQEFLDIYKIEVIDFFKNSLSRWEKA